MINRPVLRSVVLAGLVAALVVVPAALAGKGGKPGGGGGGGSTGSGGSFSLVLLNSTDGLPHHGQKVTFSISTSATKPFVSLNCYQNGVWVYAASVGYFPDYPWEQTFTLASTSWPSGSASCNARLYTSKDGTRTTTLSTMSFTVHA